jgi:tyrosyl-tRNA synthetase
LPMYVAHATAWPPEQVEAVTGELARGERHPNAAKRLVGRTVADLYHSAGAGEAAEREFDRVHKDHAQPSDIADHELASGTSWVDALVATGLAGSKREARRSIDQGAVKCDGEVVAADGVVPDGTHVVQNGKRRWARIIVR